MNWFWGIIIPCQNMWDRKWGLETYWEAVSTSLDRGVKLASDIQYSIVATSELVVNLAGPAILVGNFAATQCPESNLIMKTQLKPPSFFSHVTTLVAPKFECNLTMVLQSLLKLNWMKRLSLQLIAMEPSSTSVWIWVGRYWCQRGLCTSGNKYTHKNLKTLSLRFVLKRCWRR